MSVFPALVGKVDFVNQFEMKITNIIVLLTPKSKVLIAIPSEKLTAKTSVWLSNPTIKAIATVFGRWTRRTNAFW